MHRFARGNKNLNKRSIFSLETGPEWQLRRNLFKFPFSANRLRTQESIVTAVVSRLCKKLDEVADGDNSVEVDLLFSQMTVDIICEVAFQYSIEALEGSELYTVIPIYCPNLLLLLHLNVNIC